MFDSFISKTWSFLELTTVILILVMYTVNSLVRKLTAHDIDAHPTEDAIVISYTVDAAVAGDRGDRLQDSKQCQKMSVFFPWS